MHISDEEILLLMRLLKISTMYEIETGHSMLTRSGKTKAWELLKKLEDRFSLEWQEKGYYEWVPVK